MFPGLTIVALERSAQRVRSRSAREGRSYAELLGLKGIVCRDPEQVGAAWDEALAADRPVILNIYTDPNVPPLPPHITLTDAKNFTTMLVSEPELGSVLKNSARQVLASVLPGTAVGEVEDDGLRGVEPRGAVAPQVSPVRLAVAGLEHRNRCLVGVQHVVLEQLCPQRVDQRLQLRAALAHPLRQR